MANKSVIQDAINGTAAGGTALIPTNDYVIDTTVYDGSSFLRIEKSITIDFQGSRLQFPAGFTEKGIQVMAGTKAAPTTVTYKDRVVIKNAEFVSGTGSAPFNKGPVVFSEDKAQIGLFQIDSCSFRGLTYGPKFICDNSGGYIRNAILSNCLFENIQDNTSAGAEFYGRGAAFYFPAANASPVPEKSTGLSYANTFINCARYSLYVNQGGPFQSQGDTFIGNTVDAAISLNGGAHMAVSGGFFKGCKHGISLTAKSGNNCHDASITNCTLVNTVTNGIWLSPAPASNGVFKDVVVSGTRHYLDSAPSTPFLIGGFQNLLIKNTFIDQQSGADDYANIVMYGTGSNDMLIDGVKMRFDPVPPTPVMRVFVFDAATLANVSNGPTVVVRDVRVQPTSAIKFYPEFISPPNPPYYVNANIDLSGA